MTCRRVRVVAGAPVCEAGRLAAIAAEFEAHAAAAGERVCYFCAEGRLEAVFHGRPGRSLVLLGAQPVWNPAGWAAIIAGKASLRAQLNRARNKGVAVGERSPPAAENDPELRRCLAEWLATRGLPPLRFLVEPQTLGRLGDRRTFVAERAGRVVGFLVATPVPARAGWLVEQIVRGTDAPNGTSELLLDSAVRAVAAGGAAYLTLGLAPLSRRALGGSGMIPAEPRDPFWLRVTLGWLRAHGRRFYDFGGLEAFKAKFVPDRWEPVYAASAEPTFSPATLYAVAAAFGGVSPPLLVARAILKAARTEAARLVARR